MKTGFTRIESMVVITLAVVLVAIALPVIEGKIEEAKWSEGRAMAGQIAASLRAYAAEKGASGNYGENLPNVSQMGFSTDDLKGTYFTPSNFNWTTGLNSNGTLVFSIKVTKGDTLSSPSKYALNQNGKWIGIR